MSKTVAKHVKHDDTPRVQRRQAPLPARVEIAQQLTELADLQAHLTQVNTHIAQTVLAYRSETPTPCDHDYMLARIGWDPMVQVWKCEHCEHTEPLTEYVVCRVCGYEREIGRECGFPCV